MLEAPNLKQMQAPVHYPGIWIKVTEWDDHYVLQAKGLALSKPSFMHRVAL